MFDRLGKFQILRPLGRGSMGEVYLAQDPVLGRQVAIKTIQAGSAFGDEARARFEREARVTSTLVHPHIVTVYDFGEAEGLYYLAMEFLEGETFEAALAKGAWAREDLLEALAQVAEALAFAHEHGVVHRDVKPSNILVQRRGRRIQAKLMDFGVATIDQSSLTQQGVWMGTVNYMAPEYLDTGRASQSSDLFALGVMLFEVVTGGRRPFGGETTTTILNAILRDAPAALTPAEQQAAGPALVKVVKRALAKRPEDRFACGEALAEALRETARTLPPAPAPGDPAAPVVAVAIPATPPPVAQVPPGPSLDTGGGQTMRLPKDTGSRPLVVGRGGAATMLSLKVALRQAEPGATIRVLPGRYRESLEVDRPVRLVAEGAPGEVVLEGPRGPALTLKASDVEVVGFQLERATAEGPVVQVEGGEACLKACRIQGASECLVEVQGARLGLEGGSLQGQGAFGLRAGVGAEVLLVGLMVEGFQRAALVLEGGARLRGEGLEVGQGVGVGLWLRGGAQGHLESCQVVAREAGGVEVEDGGRLTMRGGRLAGSRMAGLLVLARGQAELEGVVVEGHGAAGLHLEEGGIAQVRGGGLQGNRGFGASLRGGTLGLDEVEVTANGAAGLLLSRGASLQARQCRIHKGGSLGLLCLSGARGVLEGCEISGNALTGARVEPGGSLLLMRCTVKDGQETGLMVFEDAEATLEQCVVHRNARGGILLSRNASDPTIRDVEGIQDDLYRIGPDGQPIRLAPLRRR